MSVSRPWRVWLPGRPPSWNDSYKIVRQSRTTGNGPHYYHTLAKKQKLIDWQADMTLVVRSAKPSHWDPGDRWIPVVWEHVWLERHIDMDNLQKAVNDVLEAATGVNDKWFYPIFAEPRVGVRRKDAGIGLIIDAEVAVTYKGDGRRLP